MMIFMGFIFLSSIQPVIMVVILILITLFYSLFLFKLLGGYWLGYVLVLVMLSGVLVVFTYMVSLMPNESFEIYNLIFIVLSLFCFMKINIFDYFFDYSFMCINLWGFFVGYFNLFLVGFLLSIMIMVVWVSCMKEGAIRVL